MDMDPQVKCYLGYWLENFGNIKATAADERFYYKMHMFLFAFSVLKTTNLILDIDWHLQSIKICVTQVLFTGCRLW